jgi:hypothetical protein
MEDNLSKILKQIKITDPYPLEIMDDDEDNENNVVQSASYHHLCLNQILNNLTCDFRPTDENSIENLFEKNDFANHQLIIQK